MQLSTQTILPAKTQEWGDDWIIYPVDGYGNQETVRSMIIQHKPDILWFMTDPRFYEWLWNFEDEIRAAMPMVYYHVWDNFPSPKFNAPFYSSNDYIATISKVTSKIVQEVVTRSKRRVYTSRSELCYIQKAYTTVRNGNDTSNKKRQRLRK